MRFILTFSSLILVTACSNQSANQAVKVTPVSEKDLVSAISTSTSPYVLVNFFATYCKPCERELPALTAMADEEENNVSMMYVSLDEPADLEKGLQAMFSRMELHVPIHHYTLPEAEAFIRKHYPDWRGDIPLNFVFRNDGTFVKALGMTDPQEVTMVIHHDQIFRD